MLNYVVTISLELGLYFHATAANLDIRKHYRFNTTFCLTEINKASILLCLLPCAEETYASILEFTLLVLYLTSEFSDAIIKLTNFIF